MDSHIYCCSRCGEIFESKTDEELCASCRVVMQRSRAQTIIYEHTCERCGSKYKSKGKTARYCLDCPQEVQREKAKKWNERARTAPPPKKKAVKPPEEHRSIAEICKLAELNGITYGRAVALIEDGKL
ncbi:MAG: hypothetical protein IJG87_03885 [Ruminococcus sp.]|nr:hypothetical protein [Ruminococcus sp.]